MQPLQFMMPIGNYWDSFTNNPNFRTLMPLELSLANEKRETVHKILPSLSQGIEDQKVLPYQCQPPVWAANTIMHYIGFSSFHSAPTPKHFKFMLPEITFPNKPLSQACVLLSLFLSSLRILLLKFIYVTVWILCWMLYIHTVFIIKQLKDI